MADEPKQAYEFSVAGFKLKLNSAFLAMAIPVATTLGGGLWAGFEFYKDYLDMKSKIAKYVAPDLSEFDKRLAVIEENSQKTSDYTRDIKTDLKTDIRRNETVTEQIERSVKQAQRELDQDLKAMQRDLRANLDKNRDDIDRIKRDVEIKLDRVNKDVDSKIQKAIDNPLAGK